MKEIFIVLVNSPNTLAKNCQPGVVDKFRKDLETYEKKQGVKLQRDPTTGDYSALSLSIGDLDRLLYRDNPWSNNILMPLVWDRSNTETKPLTKEEQTIQKYMGQREDAKLELERLPDTFHAERLQVKRRIQLLTEIITDLTK